MTYATQQDLIDRLGTSLLVQLSNVEEADTDQVNATTVTRALVDADADINSYLAKVATTPLNPVPEKVTAIAVDIAVYRLYRVSRPDSVKDDYDSAIAWLKLASGGTVALGNESAPTPAPTSGKAEFFEGNKTFNRRSMRGF